MTRQKGVRIFFFVCFVFNYRTKYTHKMLQQTTFEHKIKVKLTGGT